MIILNNKFIKSTLILIIGGFITKILGFIIKILYTREIGAEGVSLYSLIIPSYSLIITIATLALPISISKLVAEKKYDSKNILSSSFALIMLVDAILIFIILAFKNIISTNLLNEPKLENLFIAICLTIPFISASSILKGYFLGKQNMIPNTVSNIFEQILRITLILLFLPSLVEKNLLLAIFGLIILSVFSESLSIFIFLMFFPKHKKRGFTPPNLKICKDILKTTIPCVSSRLIGNIGFFFEPILLTNILLFKGFSNNYIINEYGYYNAYAIATLTLPSFFIMAISSALIPEISRYYANNNNNLVKRRINQALGISLIIGLSFSVGILIFRNPLLEILYHTTNGSEYIKILAPFFVLFYLEGPLNSALQAMNEAKTSLKITTFGVLIKLLFMSIFAYLKCGVLALVYAEIINIFFVTFLSFAKINKLTKNCSS